MPQGGMGFLLPGTWSARLMPILMRFLGKFHLAAAFMLLAGLVCTPATAQDMPSEQSLRAAMVFNFLKFTEFPPESIANVQRMRLCIAVGDVRQAEALLALSGRRAWSRELVVVRLSGRGDDCHVLYVDSRQRWGAIEEQRIFPHALTIGDYPGFARGGGMIEIALQEDGARFDINLMEGRRAGFRFSPQLLRLARHVHE